jgi:hypothetical protein
MNLALIPLFDARDGGPAAHARVRLDQAIAVRDACLGWVPAGGVLARAGDPVVRRWMRRSASPYVQDIADIQARFGRPGAWTLHGAYLFGCTALADDSAHGPRLAGRSTGRSPASADSPRWCGSADRPATSSTSPGRASWAY